MTTSMKPADLIIATFLKEDVTTGDTSRAYGLLSQFSETKDMAMAYRGCLGLSFLGYEDSPEEIYTIPEVRSFFNNINAAWPYWAWFLDCKSMVPFVPVLLSLLLPGTIIRSPSGAFGWQIDAQQAHLVITDLLNSVDELGDKLNLPAPMVQQAKRDFQRASLSILAPS